MTTKTGATARAALDHFSSLLETYRERLAQIEPSLFDQKPDAETWSVAQLFEHLCSSSAYFFGKRVQHCLAKNTDKGQEGGGLTEVGQWIMDNGAFPEQRIKIPGSGHYEYETKSKADYSQWMQELETKYASLEEQVEADPGSFRIAHGRFGELNALEYYRNNSMHWQHHLAQLDRILTQVQTK
mgnify:CR=1 FL=1